jgi:hypothetical protein
MYAGLRTSETLHKKRRRIASGLCVTSFSVATPGSMATPAELLLKSIVVSGDESAMNLERILFTGVRGIGILRS